ncbi:MAG: putative rane protein [Herbinix sp.]|nr:putative rane protein [Herbinix sp.]
MLKYIYRVIILIAVFVAALSYFGRDIKQVVFDIDNTTVMEDATFPLVTIKTGDNRINLLHGYSSNLAANLLRESVTPLDFDKTFEVLISQENYDIKKLNYEVREFVGDALIETDSVSVFEESKEDKTAKIKIKAELASDKEYAIKITLITSESKKMFYYQRVKLNNNVHLAEKLDFVLEFHNAIMNKSTAEDVAKYLEPSEDADNSSLAYVNINSSIEQVSWGNLKPTILTEIIPSVKEIYEDSASVELNYIIEAEVSGVTERYRVTEFYRVKYATDRMYLMNYERRMESIFDINLASISKSELKLGITSEDEVPFVSAEDDTKIAFVRNRELWFYNLEGNEITRVFSFRQEKTDYLRELYDQHDIRILNMDAEGNLDFLVYGYMNRGQYEGRVAIILYHFIRAENRIEELVYIPIEEPYQILKENLSELSYVNAKDIFYFHIYNQIYSYNLITHELTVIAADINKSHVVVLKDLNYAAWQESSDPKLTKNINIMDLESGEVETISAKTGYNIRLMDMIDSNIIYGFVSEGDIASMIDGSVMAPLSEVEIASVDKKILKSYSKADYYISGLEVKDNIVELRRVQKVNENGRTAYTLAPKDYIMNQVKSEAPLISTTSRVTDQALTEYYLSLPKSFIMEKLPKMNYTVNTVISQDPTIRLPESTQNLLYYYPYVTGGIAGAYDNAADAIEIAKAGTGVVVNSRQQLVWERGVKATKSTISKFENMTWTSSSIDTVENCLALLLAYQDVAVPNKQLNTDDSSAYDVLKDYSKYTPIRLTGITLDDALYYVSKGRPVIAMTDIGNAVIIYGYDAFNIMVIDPSKSNVTKMGIQDSAQMFEDAGNIFLSYLEQ